MIFYSFLLILYPKIANSTLQNEDMLNFHCVLFVFLIKKQYLCRNFKIYNDKIIII